MTESARYPGELPIVLLPFAFPFGPPFFLLSVITWLSNEEPKKGPFESFAMETGSVACGRSLLLNPAPLKMRSVNSADRRLYVIL